MFPYNPIIPNQTAQEQSLENIIQQASNQLQQLRNRPVATPTNLTQNFQITPQTQNPNELQSAYANNIDEVKNIFMTKNGIFVDKGLTVAWFKDTEGKIRTFSLIEVIEKDEKDVEIENLKAEINQMRTLLLQKNNTVEEPKKKSKKEEE